MHTMSAFDIPIHTKTISTRDFAVRHEAEAPAARKERAPGAHVAWLHLAWPALVSTLTLCFALRQALRGRLHLASCIEFYVAALLPIVLYDHIRRPSRSSNMWAAVVVHVGVMLFGYAPDTEDVSARLHALVLGVCVLILYRQAQAHHKLAYILAVAASVNSAVSLGVHALHASSAFAYYHVSFVVLFGTVLSTLYML
jgi:hypothetical protein